MRTLKTAILAAIMLALAPNTLAQEPQQEALKDTIQASPQDTIQASPQDTIEEAPAGPFKGEYYCREHGISIYLDLYGESILIPNFEFLGPVGGYMRGDDDSKLYGTWMVLKHSIDGKRATLRMTNDIGSDAQDIHFTMLNDSTFYYKTSGGNEVKKAIKHKLYKIVGEMTFTRKQPRREARREE